MVTLMGARVDPSDGSLHLGGEVEDAGLLSGLLHDHHPGEGQTLRVVLSDVTFLPSDAIGVLARAIRDGEDDAPVALACTETGLAWRVLEITGVPCERLSGTSGPD